MTVRRWLWVSSAAGLAVFLSVAVALSVAASGPGPDLAASVAPAAPGYPHPTITACRTGVACITIDVVESGHQLSADLYAAAKPPADAIVAALSTIDWCTAAGHPPCRHGSTGFRPGDSAIVQEVLRRAGFRVADVEQQSTLLIRYTVPLGRACVTGYLVPTRGTPLTNTIYGAKEDHGSSSCGV